MTKFLNLFVVALVALLGSASAFTTVQPKTTFMRPTTVAPVAPALPTSTSLAIVDPAIAEMTAKSDPVGAIIMLALFVSFWELTTPGRAKKEA